MSAEYTYDELDRLPVTKLREIALGFEVIQGVHGMNKAEVMQAICELKGIENPYKKEAERKKAEARAGIREHKMQRKTMKADFNEKKDALSKDEKKEIRRKMKKLRRETRRLANV
ncbi:hypothetical protein JXA80_01580 [bacterium]|nr:hypothetical protein [candidate division CSSED10-310 bacterium]